jgi:hypothetical protein
LFSLLFAVTVVCRVKWIGATISAAILTASASVGTPHPALVLPVVFLIYLAAMFLALRFGVLSLGAAVLLFNFGSFPLTLDSSLFYFGPSLVTLALFICLGAYCCHNAIAGRSA